MTTDDNITVTVHDVLLDPNTHSPVLFLGNDNATTVLPIWIGFAEAQTILLGRAGPAIAAPRPLMLDTVYGIVHNDLNGEIKKVEIARVREGTFYADIHIYDSRGTIHIRDARPSDAVALAVKAKAPITIARAVLDQFNKANFDNFRAMLKLLRAEQRGSLISL